MTKDDLRKIFENANVKAFYMVVRKGESSLTDRAYVMINGGGSVVDFTRHPYAGLSTTQGGRAAGAAQFIPSTWGELADRYGLTDFSPTNQDLGFVGCLVKRNAVDDIIAGRFDLAVTKCLKEWTSLPNAAESNPSWTMEKARALYKQYGGTLEDETQAPAPIEDRSVPVQPKAPTMAPLALLSIFGPIIAQLIPQVTKLFDKKTETPEKIAAAQTVIDTIVKSTSSLNAQEAVEKIQTDPAVLKEATKAVLTEPSIMSILEVGGGVTKAREHDLATMQSEKPFWQTSAVFWISIFLLPIVYWLVGSLIIGGVDYAKVDNQYLRALFMLFGTEWNGESRSGGFNLVIGLILGGICGVYYGVSVTQNKQQQQQQTGTGVGG